MKKYCWNGNYLFMEVINFEITLKVMEQMRLFITTIFFNPRKNGSNYPF